MLPQAKFIPIPRSTMSRIIDKLTEEEISELAITVAKNTVDVGLLLRGEYTLTSFLNILENWSGISCFAYKRLDIQAHILRTTKQNV